MYKIIIYGLSYLLILVSTAQSSSIRGKISNNRLLLSGATITIISDTAINTVTDSSGLFYIQNLHAGSYLIKATSIGFTPFEKKVILTEGQDLVLNIVLQRVETQLNEVTVTGTLREVRKMESPVPVEVFHPSYFKKNPTPSIFDALQNVNGVRPQLNCNVCNTGDIHINGLEGPYTMVLIDGMPIVSSLASVYGLSGIPNSLVERIEIVKGPASSLYGSEAVGGLINIITKKPLTAPTFTADFMATSWKEWNTDIGFKLNISKKISVLTGVNYFKYGYVVDNNKDNFTDVTLQDRISLFQKWNFQRKDNRLFNVAARYFYEDRWGGDIRWQKLYRGGDSLYGESIYTNRLEFLSNYQLPIKGEWMFSFSYNRHDQDSRYGVSSYIANQRISFGQLTWQEKIGHHDMLAGIALRYTYYDDNTTATRSADTIHFQNEPDKTWLPGIFLQDEITLNEKHKLLLGFRYDYHSIHKNIFTPRLAYKWKLDNKSVIRLNMGTGFRVVNLFTEDHAALTGARSVEVKSKLMPEKSYNVNLNFIRKIYLKNSISIGLDITGWYTYFNNRIIADYDTDPNKIIYDNLSGHAESKGVSMNTDIVFLNSGLKILTGATLMQVYTVENGKRKPQILTENFTGTWAISYQIKKVHVAVDYTGNIYGPMRLPLLSQLDPRRAYSPIWSIQNIQLSYIGNKQIEFYGGIKNLLNWTPNNGNPFIIARTNDPFDKKVEYDVNGKVKVTPENPYGLTFDPSYVFAPNQGRRLFIGIRLNIK